MTRASSDLTRRVWRSTAISAAGLWLLLFVPAWTLDYWQAWVLWLLFLASSIAATVYLLKRDPALVERRLSVGPSAEREKTQKIIMTVASLCFALLLILPGIDHRLRWSAVPVSMVLVGELGVLIGYALIYAVIRQNSYAAATIRVERGQPLVSSGLYAIVRHPMYAGALLFLGSIPLALGSYWGLLLAIPSFAILAWRAVDEERVLLRDLSGYAEYSRKVRWRVIPGLS